nr:hypothetical protein CFP56_20249 [Quercus suber]
MGMSRSKDSGRDRTVLAILPALPCLWSLSRCVLIYDLLSAHKVAGQGCRDQTAQGNFVQRVLTAVNLDHPQKLFYMTFTVVGNCADALLFSLRRWQSYPCNGDEFAVPVAPGLRSTRAVAVVWTSMGVVFLMRSRNKLRSATFAQCSLGRHGSHSGQLVYFQIGGFCDLVDRQMYISEKCYGGEVDASQHSPAALSATVDRND